jgi:hypothetical protein
MFYITPLLHRLKKTAQFKGASIPYENDERSNGLVLRDLLAPVTFPFTSGYTASRFETRDMHHYAFGTTHTHKHTHVRLLHKMNCAAKDGNKVN